MTAGYARPPERGEQQLLVELATRAAAAEAAAGMWQAWLADRTRGGRFEALQQAIEAGVPPRQERLF